MCLKNTKKTKYEQSGCCIVWVVDAVINYIPSFLLTDLLLLRVHVLIVYLLIPNR